MYTGARTEMFFPIGRSDMRFYLNGSDGVEQYYLVSESKTRRGVKKDWMLSLVRADRPENLPPPRGTLEKFLRSRGLQFKSLPNKEIRAWIERVSPFAYYKYDVGPVVSRFYFGVVGADGILIEAESGLIDLEQNHPAAPKTTKPYPVTKFEREKFQRK
jgi:hypothetical protein